jgi:hypothetical protein
MVRQHRLVHGCIQAWADATLYGIVMLAVLWLLGQLAKIAI